MRWAVVPAAAALMAAGVLLLGGIGVSGLGQPSRTPPTITVPSQAAPVRTRPPRHHKAPSPRARPAPPPMRPADTRAMAASAPVRLSIPAIGVNAGVIGLGADAEGRALVPPLTRPEVTSWFDEGPAPGQVGPAAVYGHVDTAVTGPAVFYRLGDLVAGDLVTVARADRERAVFQVYRVAEFPKDAFPTMAVYGDTAGPELRLITCGGTYDAASGGYDDNIVAYARLIAGSLRIDNTCHMQYLSVWINLNREGPGRSPRLS